MSFSDHLDLGVGEGFPDLPDSGAPFQKELLGANRA